MAWFQYSLSHTTPEFLKAVWPLPGVMVRDRSITVEDNAGWLIEQLCDAHAIRFKAHLVKSDLAPLKAVDDLCAVGLREWVPAFMTQYQRDAVLAFGHRSGHLWHAAGCLAGDTEIVVNRGGSARRMPLRQLVEKFNGAITRHPRNGRLTAWDPSIPTYTQSVDEATGFIRKNKIVAAIDSGIKTTYTVRTESDATIRATADHRFWTPTGWKKLGDLNVGDDEVLEVLSAEEHLRKHGQEEGWKHVSARAMPTKIWSIEKHGEEQTYDLTMEDPHNSFVANGIVVHNSGKTLTSIAWSLARPGNTLVVTRAAVRRNYGREIERFTEHRAHIIETAADAAPAVLEDTEALYVVIGWEMLADCLESILKWKPVNVIYDELHKCKSNKRWEATPTKEGKLVFSPRENMAYAAYKISRLCTRRLGATATPVKDRVRDLWAQLDLVHPDAWGKFYSDDKPSFTGRYCAARRGSFGGIETTGSSNLDELWDRVSISTHHVPHSVTHRHLPPRRRLVTYVKQGDLNAATGFAAAYKKAARTGGRGAVLELKLMEAAAKKRKFLMELLEEAVENGQKVFVFTGRREDCDKLAEAVRDAFGNKALVISGHGGTPAAERDQMQQDYMASTGATILVGTGDAWGEGVNLQDSDLLIIAMLPYTPGQIVQWEGRVARHGQKRPVLIQYLVAEGTVDEHVAEILLTKLPAVERVAQDDSVQGLADQLRGSDQEEEILDSILSKLGA